MTSYGEEYPVPVISCPHSSAPDVPSHAMNPLLLWFHKLGSPPYFYSLAGRFLPWLWAIALIGGAIGLYGGLVVAPADYQQGQSFRIIYIHAPSAWMSLFGYIFMAVNGF